MTFQHDRPDGTQDSPRAKPIGGGSDPLATIREANRPKDSGLLTISAAELQRKDFPPINWIVPNVLPEGLTLLCGKPKLGKSWLVLDWALAVASGGETLGRDVEGGGVLYAALEDNERRLQKRCNLIARGMDWPEQLDLVMEAPRAGAGLEVAIHQWADTCEAPRLMLVDTWGRVKPLARVSDNAHSADYAALSQLHRLANDLGLVVVVVHHV